MFDREVLEPRLTARWTANAGEELRPAILEAIRRVLAGRYAVDFDSV